MPIGLRATLAPSALTNSYATPEENAASALDAEQTQLQEMNTLQRGLARGLYQTPAGINDAIGQVIEPFSPTMAQPLFNWSAEQRAIAQRMHTPDEVQSFDQVNDLSTLGNYVAGKVGENIPNMLTTIPAGMVARIGLRGAMMGNTGKNILATSIGAFPQQTGEGVSALREDPAILENTTPLQRLGYAAGYGALTAPMEAADDALLMGRAMGGGKALKNVFKDGIGASVKDAAKHVAMAVPEAALTEGVPEAMQQKTQQLMQSHLNPLRDTSKDEHDLKESFFGGWAAGGPTSIVGRGSDVAWAQGRGAKDAVISLLEPKKLPAEMQGADDQSIYQWDQADNANRNQQAARLAEHILSDDKGSETLRQKAGEFFERLKTGAADAWQSMSDGLGLEQKYNDGVENAQRFIDTAKQTWSDLGKLRDAKANAEAAPADQQMYSLFSESLDPQSKVARNTELKSNLYDTLTHALTQDNWNEIPYHDLADTFTSEDRAKAAIMQLRENLVRTGRAKDEPGFASLLDAVFSDGVKADEAKRDVMFRYGQSWMGKDRERSAGQLRQGVRAVSEMLRKYPDMKPEQKQAFDREMLKEYGKNTENVIKALAPKSVQRLGPQDESHIEETNVERGVEPTTERVTPEYHFIGQKTEKARMNLADGKTETLADHGGLWNLGHMDKETRDGIRGNYMQEMRSLRQQGATVEEVKPLEYARLSGVPLTQIARSLGLSVKSEEDARAALEYHPARMLMVEKQGAVGLSRHGNEEVTAGDIEALHKTTHEGQKGFLEQFVPEDKAEAVRAAFNMGKGKMKALRELGFPNAVALENTPRGLKVKNNLNHGNMGRFEVEMKLRPGEKTPRVFTLSAQEVIKWQRARGRMEAEGGSPLQLFTAAVAQIRDNPEVAKIHVKGIFGKKQEAAKYKPRTDREGNRISPEDAKHVDKAAKKHAEIFGPFGPFFRLQPDLTMGRALNAQNAYRGQLNRSTHVDEAEETVRLAEEKLSDAIVNEEAAELHLERVKGVAKRKTARLELAEARHEREQAEAHLADAEEALGAADELNDTLEGDGEKQATGGEDTRPQSVKDAEATGLENDPYNAAAESDFNQDGTPKHPFGKPHETGFKPGNTDISNTYVQQVRGNLSASDFTKSMQNGIKAVSNLRKYVQARTARLDVAQDFINRAASAQHSGDRKGAAALLAAAYHEMYEAVAEEALTYVNTALENGTDVSPIDAAKGEGLSVEDKAKLDTLKRAMVRLQEKESVYQANKEAILENSKGYKAFSPLSREQRRHKVRVKGEFADRFVHHNHFLAAMSLRTLDELVADGVSRKARIDGMSSAKYLSEKQQQLLSLMMMEQKLARKEIRRRREGGEQVAESAPTAEKPAGYPLTQRSPENSKVETPSETQAQQGSTTEASDPAEVKRLERNRRARERRAERKAAAEREAQQKREAEQKAFDEAVSEAVDAAVEPEQTAEAPRARPVKPKVKESLIKAAEDLKAAYRTLDDAMRTGELNKSELVAQFRSALKHFREAAVAAGQLALKKLQAVTRLVQMKIHAYQRANAAVPAAEQFVKRALKKHNEVSQHVVDVDDKTAELVRRAANRVRELFETGTELMEDDGKLSAYEGFVTIAHNDNGVLRMSAIPSELFDSLQASFMENAPEGMDDMTASSVFSAALRQSSEFLRPYAVFNVLYDTESGNVDALSSDTGSVAEMSMRNKQVLGLAKAKSDDGLTTINKLEGLGHKALVGLLGEAVARFKAITGKDELQINWIRGSGANIGKTGSAKFNAESVSDNSESVAKTVEPPNSEGSAPSGKGVTKEQMNSVRAYIDKVLGPGVKLQLAKDLGGNSASWERVNGEVFIKLATHAANPLSKAHHEAMHEFFQRLKDTHPDLAATIERAASSPAVVSQLRNFFKGDANYARIVEALKDPHERAAYMYQLWAANRIKLGPKTESVFQKIATFFRNLFGKLSDSQMTEAILQHFHNGQLTTPSDVARVLQNDKALVADYLHSSGSLFSSMSAKARELLITAQNELLDSGNKALEGIGRQFSNETGAHDNRISFLSARAQKSNQMNDRFFNIIRGLDKKQLSALTDHMQQGTQSSDTVVAKAQERLHRVLSGEGGVFEYLQKADVKSNRVENYFPRSWDSAKIAENKERFVELLMKDAEGKLDENAAKAIAETLVKNRGAEPLTESEYRVGYTPYMPESNKRVLDFIKSPEFADFQNKDITAIMTTYIAHAAHRAEYARRFGNKGEKLRTSLKDAVQEEVGSPAWKEATTKAEEVFRNRMEALKKEYGKDNEALAKALAAEGYVNGEPEVSHIVEHLNEPARKKFSAFEGQLRRATRAIMAMEGSLGYDINPTLRKAQSGIIVYENMRLLTLSLLSQVIDPLGIMVRGGTMADALEAFKRGISGTIAGWKGTPMEDSMTRLAMQLGIIDAGNFLNSQGQMYTGLFMGEKAKWFNDRLFRWNGVEGFSQGTRVGAMMSAINFIKFHAGEGTKDSKRFLAELGLTKEDVKLKDGELDYADHKIQDAIFRWVDSAILRPNAALRPSWASDPHYALFFHMKQFTYAAHKVLLERVLNEFKHGNTDPMFVMAVTFVPAMIASDILRGFINYGGEPPWKKKWTVGDYVADGVQRAGLFGIPQLGLDVAKWGPAEMTGPFGEQLVSAAKTYHKSYKVDKHLDERAASTGRQKDVAKAEVYEWWKEGSKRTLRASLPYSEPMKKLTYDQMLAEMG